MIALAADFEQDALVDLEHRLAAEARQDRDEEFVARLANIAYQAVLLDGLRRPFLEVELDIWQQVRAAVRAELHWTEAD
jgi:hypothetical protein